MQRGFERRRATCLGSLLGRAVVILLMGSTGCAASRGTVKDELNAYREALLRRDAPAVWRASDPGLQALMSVEELQTWMDKNPRTVQTAAESLRVQTVRSSAEVTLKDGRVVQMIQDRGGWKVRAGVLSVPRLDTPHDALRTFLFASRGHMSLLRRTLPKAAQQTFASDAELALQLTRLQPRIARLKQSLKQPWPEPHVDGVHARMTYADQKSVRFKLEDGSWRVVDLE